MSSDLSKRYDRLFKRSAKIQKEMDALVKEAYLTPDCDHSKCWEHDEDRDDGYGKWWKVRMRGCFICGRRWQVYSDHIREVDPWR